MARINSARIVLENSSSGRGTDSDGNVATIVISEPAHLCSAQWATREICKLAKMHCNGRVVSALEGGYDLEGLSKSAAAHVIALMRG